MKAPFPYFGGKSTVADLVWSALGQPKHYIEPFFGSGAVLLSRPGYDPTTHIETVNDKDGFVCNVWRALQHDPDVVARWCDWPVNHADLAARRNTLIVNEEHLLENLISDDDWYDPKLAGYWIWSASCWIGNGLTSERKTEKDAEGAGPRPHVCDGGKGIHSIGKIPHVSDGGTGIHSIGKIPHVSNEMSDVQDVYNTNIYTWFRELSERLRYVRVVCGDWLRVCGGNWQDDDGLAGIFFDPPYGVTDRNTNIYHHDSVDVASDVTAWCIKRGERKSYRIVVAGYEEHAELLEHGWSSKSWKTKGGYANVGKQQGQKNRFREVIYLSPYCITDTWHDTPLFSQLCDPD